MDLVKVDNKDLKNWSYDFNKSNSINFDGFMDLYKNENYIKSKLLFTLGIDL
jgi:hypothetical protein